MTTADAERQVAPALVQALLHYVREVGGDDAFAAVAGAVPIPVADLVSDSRWFSSAEAIAIADAAARVCHDEHIGVRAGTELWWILSGRDGYLGLLRSAGSIFDALSGAAKRGSKMSTGRTLEVRPGGDDHVLMVCHYTDLANAHRFYCGLTAGFYSQVPLAFGMSGSAIELSCQLDGAEECGYRGAWRPDHRTQAPDVETLAGSGERAQRVIDQLEQVHQLTSQLLSADG